MLASSRMRETPPAVVAPLVLPGENAAWPSIALAAAALALHAGATAFVLSGRLSLAPGIAATTLASYLAFTPMHEAAHGNIARGRGRAGSRAEAAVGWLSAALLAAPFCSFRQLHLRHHQRTNDPLADPDFWVAGSSAFSVGLRCLTILPRYYAAFLRVPDETQRQPLVKTAMTQLVFASALIAAARHGRLIEVLALWPVSAILATAALGFFFNWLPHHPHAGRERFHDARVVLLPGLGVVTMGHAYHLVHHLWPQTPFWRYGAAFRALRPMLEREGCRIDDAGAGLRQRVARVVPGARGVFSASPSRPSACTEEGSAASQVSFGTIRPGASDEPPRVLDPSS
jgi:fatty acid desaturase